MHCSSSDIESLKLKAELPMFEPILEDEHHVLKSCLMHEDIRQSLSPQMRNRDPSDLFDFDTIKRVRATARFLVKANKRRFASTTDEKKKTAKILPSK
jgi:hypothetical protein